MSGSCYLVFPPRVWERWRHAIIACALLGVGWGAWADEDRFPTIPLKLVDGRLCARCTLVGPSASIPANVVIDLGLPRGVVVHSKPAALLGLDKKPTLTLAFEAVRLADLRAYAADVRALENLSRDHAAELGEIPAMALVGLPAFENYRVDLEVGAGTLRLLPPEGEDAAEGPSFETGGSGPALAATAPAGQQRFVGQFDAQPSGYWLFAKGPEDYPVRVRFSTGQHDTLIERTVAALLEGPEGRIAVLRLGDLNLAERVAFRPEDLSSAPGQPQLVLGTGLLFDFRVTISLPQRRLVLTPLRSPRFPHEEHEFFALREATDADGLEEWLNANGSSRLAAEAASMLVSWRLARSQPDANVVERALRLRAQVAPAERRAQTLVGIADELLNGRQRNREELAELALRMGLEFAGDDLNARAVHDIHARQGLLALRRDDLPQARRLLLSAAFGIPKDPLVNLWLGQLYERMGKPLRAWSRYAQAFLVDDGLVAAVQGLNRLNRDPNFRATFSMHDAEQLLEGRCPDFHPAERYRRSAGNDELPAVQFVELFTCADEPDTAAAELAFGGLREYFDGTSVVFVQYHVSVPRPDPLTTDFGVARAAFYGVTDTPVVRINGRRAVDVGGDERALSKVFNEYKVACELAPTAEDGWRLRGHILRSGTELVGQVEIEGPESSGAERLFAVVCERVVMLPGADTLLLRRHVVRGALCDPNGWAVPRAADRQPFHLRVTREWLADTLEETVTRLERDRDVTFHMRPTYVDLDACFVVAFLQDVESRQILAATCLRPPSPENDPSR
jgi:hypothetical protein